jgi:hypothetical protein
MVYNQGYDNIAFFTQNDSCKDIMKFGTLYAKHSVKNCNVVVLEVFIYTHISGKNDKMSKCFFYRFPSCICLDGGPQGRSGWVRKISSPPEFDPRTVQSVVSHYTDYVILAYSQ